MIPGVGAGSELVSIHGDRTMEAQCVHRRWSGTEVSGYTLDGSSDANTGTGGKGVKVSLLEATLNPVRGRPPGSKPNLP